VVMPGRMATRVLPKSKRTVKMLLP
jgi:hypothetical protein